MKKLKKDDKILKIRKDESSIYFRIERITKRYAFCNNDNCKFKIEYTPIEQPIFINENEVIGTISLHDNKNINWLENYYLIK